jgi:hypothetical protein
VPLAKKKSSGERGIAAVEPLRSTTHNAGHLPQISAAEAQDLCELLEERTIKKSTLLTTQLPLDQWSEVIGDPVIADAIRDRFEHSACNSHHRRRTMSRTANAG